MASISEQRPARLAIVLLVCAVFMWLRWDNWPKIYFADELIPLAVVQHMVQTGTLDTNWDNADWSGNYAAGDYDLRQYNFSSYHVTLRVLKALVSPWQADLPDIVLYRYISVFFQALALLLVMDLVRRILNWPLAGLAGLFVAVMPQSVIDAHYARPETFVTLLVAANLWLAWFSCKSGFSCQLKKTLWTDVLAAWLWGVAFACKISLLPMAVLAWGFLLWRKQPLPVLAAWWLVFLAGFAVSAPYALMDPQGFAGGAGILFKQYGPDMAVSGGQAFTSAAVMVKYLWAFFGWPVCLLVLVAGCTRTNPLRALVWASVVATVFYCLVFAYQKVFFERNLSHLIPLWSVLLVCGVSVVWRWMMLVFTDQTSRFFCQVLLVILLAGMLAERAGLSADIVRTCFGGSTVVADTVSGFEKNLLAAQQRASITRMSPMRDYAHVDRFPSDALLQVPRYKVPEQDRLDALLQHAGWVAVARLDLPLGYLPYNQLQINHAPVAYDYYVQRAIGKPPSGEQAP